MHTCRHDIYKAKAARRPARPAPPMRAEMELAAPVAEGAAPEPVWSAEPEPEPERDAPTCTLALISWRIYHNRTRGGGVGCARAGTRGCRRSSCAGNQRTSLRRGEEFGDAALYAVGELLRFFGRTITLVALRGAFGGLYSLGRVGARNAHARGPASTAVV